MNKILAAALCGSLLAFGAAQATAAVTDYAASTPSLRLNLRNDLRRSMKPADAPNDDVYAWVQGAILEFDSGWFNDFIAVEGGGFWVQKLDTSEGKFTRGYLNGDDESFGYLNAALKVRLGDYGIVKAGRFVTDLGYGAMPYRVPLITNNSNRTLPTSSQGVLAYLTPTDWLDVWAMWRNEVFTAKSSLYDGYRDEGVFDPVNMSYDAQKRSRSFIALSFHDEDKWRLSIGASYQRDVSNQFEVDFSNRMQLGDYRLKNNLCFFHADVNDDTWEMWQRAGIMSDDNFLVTGAHELALSWGGVFFTWEYIKHATVSMVIDTDIGFRYPWTIDRNLEDMWSFGVGATYRVGDFHFFFAPLYTNGYEDYSKNVSVEGMDFNAGVMYRASSGPLKGLTSYLFGSRAFEDRLGSEYGDHLNYWDIKFCVQYKHDFLQ